MRKYWNKIGLKKAEDDLLLMASCLALTSPDNFMEGIQIVRKKIKDYDSKFNKKLKIFVLYMQRYWGNRRNQLCVGHLPHRTNNLSESLNHRLGQKLGGMHPGIWKFLGTVATPKQVHYIQRILNQNKYEAFVT